MSSDMPDSIPDDWLETTLGAIGSFSTSSVDKKEISSESTVMLINYMDVYRNNFIDHCTDLMQITATKSEMNRFKVRPGDILFTPSSETPDDIGHSAVVVEELLRTLHSYHTVRLRPDGNVPIELRFSGWFANSRAVLEHFARRAAGSTRYTLSLSEFRDTPIVLPGNVSEQRQIAEILDTLDRIIRLTKQIIAKLKQIKQGLVHDLLTRGIDEDGELRDPKRHPDQFKLSPLGQIPRDWTVCSAGQLCRSIVPGRDKPDLDGGPLPWITVSDLAELYVSRSLLGLSLSHTAVRKASGRTVPEGAVIMSCVGEFGLTGIASTELVVNQQLHGFICGDKITAEWLAYFLAKQGSYIDRISQQTTIKYLNKAGCESILIAIPTLDEQIRIANVISIAERTSQAERRRFDKLSLLKRGLMEDLLTGRVRVTKLKAAA